MEDPIKWTKGKLHFIISISNMIDNKSHLVKFSVLFSYRFYCKMLLYQVPLLLSHNTQESLVQHHQDHSPRWVALFAWVILDPFRNDSFYLKWLCMQNMDLSCKCAPWDANPWAWRCKCNALPFELQEYRKLNFLNISHICEYSL